MSNTSRDTQRWPKYLRPQFSLRLLIIVTVLIAPALAYFGNIGFHVRRQRAIVTRIDELCGCVFYEHQDRGGNSAPAPGPEVVRRFFGDDAYTHVSEVFVGDDRTRSIPGSGFVSWTNSDLAILPGLSRLERLHVSKLAVDDEGIRSIAQIRRLGSLWLQDPALSADGLAQLRHNKQLVFLQLQGPKVTDSALAGLRDLGGLKHLVLNDAPITSIGVQHLEKLTELHTVKISSGKNIDDEALISLAKLPNLTTLEIRGSRISGAGLAAFRGHRYLSDLNLEGAEITDPALPFLVELPVLRKLNLARTKITTAGLPAIATISSLEELDLTDNGLGRTSKTFFAKHPKLRTLEL